MKKIALEEAVIVPGQEHYVPEHKTHPEFSEHFNALLDMGEQRIKAMDDGGIALSILSLTTPGAQGLVTDEPVWALVRQWNDYLSDKVALYPKRFKALAALPTSDVQAAIDEAVRIASLPAFVGIMLNGFDNCQRQPASYFDEPKYRPLWSKIAELNIPVYLHPRSVPDNRETTYQPYAALRGAAWGFHIETAEHVLRLIFSGLFDEYPHLNVLIGHMGEMLPFWAWRIDHRVALEGWKDKIKCRLSVTDYLKRNIFITTSGIFNTPALMHAIAVVGADRIMYSVDYPYEEVKDAADWFNKLVLPKTEKEAIAYHNAANLFDLNM